MAMLLDVDNLPDIARQKCGPALPLYISLFKEEMHCGVCVCSQPSDTNCLI